MGATHEVTNQVPPLVGHDPIAGDTALAEAFLRHADAATLASLADLGRLAGSEQAREWGRVADENPGADSRFDDAVEQLHTELGDPEQLSLRARRIAGLLALCLQGSLLLRHAPGTVADAFCASRLGGDWGAVLGTLPAGTAVAEIIERARVEGV